MDFEISVAPMMACTDRHCRYFFRLLAPHIRLYTEMVTADAIVRGRSALLLRFDPLEHPVAVQLGGSDPRMLAEAARRAEDAGFDEINLNVGCPSDRVSEGAFGACLMNSPMRVGECVSAMRSATSLPVTVKTRIGIDDRDDYEFLAEFVRIVSGAGCGTFVVHARKAILGGLSPRENRTIPPLRYEVVRRLKADFGHLRVLLNGGVDSIATIEAAAADGFDGVMIGRKAYADPYWLTTVERRFFNCGDDDRSLPARGDVLETMADYAARAQAEGVRLHHVTRHMLGLYHGEPGARGWRRFLSTHASSPEATPDVLRASARYVENVIEESLNG